LTIKTSVLTFDFTLDHIPVGFSVPIQELGGYHPVVWWDGNSKILWVRLKMGYTMDIPPKMAISRGT
jgi:hypothetical protein